MCSRIKEGRKGRKGRNSKERKDILPIVGFQTTTWSKSHHRKK